MLAGLIARLSWYLLAACGLALLFAPDALLPLLIPAFPPSGVWIAQVFAAALLGLGVLAWLNQSALLGGVYGRHVVMPMAAFYFIAATSFVRPLLRGALPVAVWIVAAPVCVFAALWCWLLFRGPFARDLAQYQRSTSST